jgi:hypothetical protein
MMPFFVTRQVFTGAGKLGAENNADPCEYQISQRADFLETEVGLETMHSRPIVNTRDEPHADPEKYRRLDAMWEERRAEGPGHAADGGADTGASLPAGKKGGSGGRGAGQP